MQPPKERIKIPKIRNKLIQTSIIVSNDDLEKHGFEGKNIFNKEMDPKKKKKMEDFFLSLGCKKVGDSSFVKQDDDGDGVYHDKYY